ncbi:MAG: hypothetical protein RIK87_30700 [Fuerstiella sp.]
MPCRRAVVSSLSIVFLTGVFLSADAVGQPAAPTNAQLIQEKKALQQRLNELAAEKRAAEAERDHCEKTLTGLREVHAKVVKENAAQSDTVESLRQMLADLQKALGKARHESAALQNSLNTCRQQLAQKQTQIDQRERDIELLKKASAERAWVLAWLRHRFPGTYGNEFNIEAMVGKLGGSAVPSPAPTKPALPDTGYAPGYLLLRMPDSDDQQICVGGVPVAADHQLFRLITIPMSDWSRTVAVRTHGYETFVDIRSGNVTRFDGNTGTYQGQAP